MRKILLFVCLFTSFIGFAQDNTIGEKEEPRRDTLFYPDINSRLLIIPFEPKLYRGEIDKDIGEYNGLNFQELRGYYRLGLDNALYLAAKDNYDVVRFHADDADINKDLYFVYRSTGYANRIVPKEDEEEEKKVMKAYNKMVSKIKKEDEAPPPGTRMEQGQIQNVPDKNDKFMARTIVNENVLDYCEEKYMAGLFLFINQLDVVNAPGVDWTQFAHDDYPRMIRVHYTIFSKDEVEIHSGVAVEYFSSQTKDIREIIANHFTKVAEQVIKKVPILVVQQSEELLTD